MGRRANGEGSITTTIRNGKTYYRGSVTVGTDSKGNQIRKTFGSYKKSVIIDKMNTAKYESKNNALSNSDVTFGNLFLNWIKNFKSVEVGNNTFVKYETTYKLRIEPYFINSMKANKISLNDLQKYFNELQEKYTPMTIRQTYVHVNSCLNFAMIQGVVVKNFCKGVTLQKVKKEKKIKVFSKVEQERIIQMLDTRDVVDTAVYLTFYTGLRLGEVLGLEWDDLKENLLQVKRQYARLVSKKETGGYKLDHELRNLKTSNSEREIPIPDKVINLLEKLKKNSNLIFSDEKGKGLDHKRLQRRVTKICKDLNIPHRSFHSIRHSYATRLFELGVPIKTVQVLMGHKDISTTMNIYTHVMKEMKMEVLEKLNLI